MAKKTKKEPKKEPTQQAPAGTKQKKAPIRVGKTKELSEFERYKRQRNVRKKANAVLGVLAITCLCAVLVLGFGGLSSSELGNMFRSQISHSTSFPRPMTGGVVRQMEATGWDVALLNDAQLLVYDNKGNETLRQSHGMAAPILVTSGNRILVYDQGGKKYLVASADKLIYSGEASGAIHAADIASDGTVAIASSTSKNSTLVTVYDTFNIGMYYWTSSSMVSSVALSPDGRRAAISLLGAQGGAVVTTVCLLDLTSSEDAPPIFTMEVPGEFGYYITFKEQTLSLITDVSVKSIDNMGRVRSSFNYDGQQVMMFADGGLGHTVIVLGNYRYMRSSDIISLDDKCKELGRITLDGSPQELRANDNGFYYLTEGKVAHYDYKCQPLSTTAAAAAITYLPLGQDLYVATYEELRKLAIR